MLEKTQNVTGYAVMPFPKLSTWATSFVEYSTDGTGRPGSSSLRPLGLKPVRPLRFHPQAQVRRALDQSTEPMAVAASWD